MQHFLQAYSVAEISVKAPRIIRYIDLEFPIESFTGDIPHLIKAQIVLGSVTEIHLSGSLVELFGGLWDTKKLMCGRRQ